MKTPPPIPRSHRRLGVTPDRLWLLVAALAVFLLFRPYQGIIHDARLYVGYAMAALDPAGIGRDIVFVNDGQSKFSVYPILMQELAESLGPSHAAIVLTYSGLLLWFVAFCAFVRALVGDRMSHLQVTAVIVLASSLPLFYGGQGVFRAAEFYATPRDFAEAAVLAALAAILARRMTLAMLALAVGMVFHPLMTAPGIGIALWYRAESPRARRLLMGVVACGSVSLVGGTLLLDGAGTPFARFDTAWMNALNTKHALVFLRTWHVGDYSRIIVHVVTVFLSLPLLAVDERRVVEGAVVIALAGALLSAVGGDLASNILLVQVQPWRGLWTLSVISAALLGLLVASSWTARGCSTVAPGERDLKRASVVFLLTAWLVSDLNALAFIFALLAAMLWKMPRRMPNVALPEHGLRYVGMTCAAGIALIFGAKLWIAVSTSWSSPDTSMRFAWHTVIATGLPGLVVLAVSCAVLTGRLIMSERRTERLPLPAAAFMVIAVAVLDSRSRYQRFVERELDRRAAATLPAVVPPNDETVVWPYADLEPWAIVGHPGWGTIVQGMPSVFDRTLAIQWSRRRNRLAQVGLLPTAQTGAETIASIPPRIDSVAVNVLCAQPDPPDILMMPIDTATVVGREEILRPAVERVFYPSALGRPWGRVMAYRVLRCDAVRRSGHE